MFYPFLLMEMAVMLKKKTMATWFSEEVAKVCLMLGLLGNFDLKGVQQTPMGLASPLRACTAIHYMVTHSSIEPIIFPFLSLLSNFSSVLIHVYPLNRHYSLSSLVQLHISTFHVSGCHSNFGHKMFIKYLHNLIF